MIFPIRSRESLVVVVVRRARRRFVRILGVSLRTDLRIRFDSGIINVICRDVNDHKASITATWNSVRIVLSPADILSQLSR
jgi:putative N-acetylmannosamine-6-phosphate epimerase